MTTFLNRKLQPVQMYWVFVTLCLLFVLPLILADSLYLDDWPRAQIADGQWAQKDGRIMQSVMYGVLTLSVGVPNIFPLPLLLATLTVAAALTGLTRHYFKNPDMTHALVVLPLWFSPFFLQNLSYHYDGAGMAIGLAAMIFAVTYRSSTRWLQLLVPGLLIAAGLAFYQLLINVVIGLYCIEMIRAAQERWPAVLWYQCLKGKLLNVTAGLLIYHAAAWPWLKSNPRTAMLQVDNATFVELARRLHQVVGCVGLLVTDGNRWLCVLMAGGALFWFGLLAARILRLPERPRQRGLLLLLYLLTVPTLLLAVPGAFLLFEDFNPAARMLTGLGSLLLAMFYLLHSALQRVGYRSTLLLCLPLIWMLSFAFAYGRVLQVQKLQTERIALQISMDISANPDLARLPVFFLQNDWEIDPWLPGGYGSFRYLPALRFVLNVYQLTLPEILPRYGVVNMEWQQENDPVLYRSWPAPIVDNRFYNIYIEHDAGYVMMKQLRGSQPYGVLH